MTRSDPQRASEAHAIQAAAERLLSGTPQRSSGRLSVVGLAAEAGLNRTKLYDHHRELVEEFLNNAGHPLRREHRSLVVELRAAHSKINDLQQVIADQDNRIANLTAALVELSIAADNQTGVTRLHG